MNATQHDGLPHPLVTAEGEEMPTEFEILETAVRELAIAHGLFSAADHRQWLEWMDSASPALGARAWVDDAYRERALANGTAAAQEIGITMYDRDPLIVMPNTPQAHNLIVCTLCSCYPRAVLGLPPDWYKSPSYRRRAVRWPRALLAEFGTISSRPRSTSTCMTPTPTCATSCCRCARPGRRNGPRSSWPASSPGTA